MRRARCQGPRRPLVAAVLVATVAGCGGDRTTSAPADATPPAPSSPPAAPSQPAAGGDRTVTGVIVPGTPTPGRSDGSSATTSARPAGSTTGVAGATVLASIDATGVPASLDALALPGALAGGGRAVVFESAAPNLAGSATASRQVFIRDLARSVLELVSVTPAGALGDGDSFGAVVSSDGRFVAFASAAADLAGGDNLTTSVYLRDRASGRTQLASRGVNGALADGPSADVTISSDGSRVGFSSVADNLVAADRNGRRDVFLFDARLATVTRVSITSAAGELSGDSAFPALSPDGRFVAFVSTAAELVRGRALDALAGDVYLRDLTTGSVTLVSGTARGDTGDGPSGGAGLVGVSQLGTRVAFTTLAGNLISGLPSGVSQVLVADATSGFLLASSATAGAPGDGDSSGGSISSDGRFVAFVSLANNLDPAGQPPPGVYVHDFQTGRTARVDPSPASSGPVPDLASPPSLSSDGGWVSWVARGGASGVGPRGGSLPSGVAEVYVAQNPLAP